MHYGFARYRMNPLPPSAMKVASQSFAAPARAHAPSPAWHLAHLAAILLAGLTLANTSAWTQTPPHPQPAATSVSNDLYRTGVALAQQGKLEEAIATLQRALAGDARNPSILEAIGAAYSLKGDLPQATEYFLKCIAADPAFVSARKNLAITYFNMGRFDVAAAEFQKVRGVAPSSDAIANLFLGIIAEKNARHGDAVQMLEASGALLNRYPEAILSLVAAELGLNQLQRAQEVLSKFDTAPGIAAVQYLLAAEFNARLGRNQKALEELDKATRQGIEFPRVAYQRAVVLDAMGRSHQAAALLTELISKTPDSEALNLLAHVAQKTGDLALAMQSLRQAAKLDPSREENYVDFSTICTDHGNYPLALEGAEIGLEHIPNSYRLLTQKGVALDNLGRFEEAEKSLRLAAELQTANSVALLSLAIVQTHAGQLQDAERTLLSAVSRFPDDYYMHYEMGKIFLGRREADPDNADLSARAKRAFEEAIRCNPSFGDSYFQLAKLCLANDPKLAEQYLAKCLAVSPAHAPAEYMLARLYIKSGRRAAGQSLIDRFERQQQADKEDEKKKPRIELVQR